MCTECTQCIYAYVSLGHDVDVQVDILYWVDMLWSIISTWCDWTFNPETCFIYICYSLTTIILPFSLKDSLVVLIGYIFE